MNRHNLRLAAMLALLVSSGPSPAATTVCYEQRDGDIALQLRVEPRDP
jgi:hypothetical protein